MTGTRDSGSYFTCTCLHHNELSGLTPAQRTVGARKRQKKNELLKSPWAEVTPVLCHVVQVWSGVHSLTRKTKDRVLDWQGNRTLITPTVSRLGCWGLCSCDPMKSSGNHKRVREREFFICCSSKAQFLDVSMCNGQDLGTTVLSPRDISVQTRSIEKCGQQTAPYSSHFRRATSDFSRLTCSLYLSENKWNLS